MKRPHIIIKYKHIAVNRKHVYTGPKNGKMGMSVHCDRGGLRITLNECYCAYVLPDMCVDLAKSVQIKAVCKSYSAALALLQLNWEEPHSV